MKRGMFFLILGWALNLYKGNVKKNFHSSPSFDPTGESTPPPASPSQLLYVQVEPRYSIYLSSETNGSFIVDATLSKYFGTKYQALINGVGCTTRVKEQV
jgi:hypothetical protein